MNSTETAVRAAKAQSLRLASSTTQQKNAALEKMAEALDSRRGMILEANAADVQAAADGGLSDAMIKRLTVDDSRIDGMVAGIRDVIKLDDPVGRTLEHTQLDDGLDLYQVSCPIGMIGVIFESRPDVVPQIMSLCLKSGNGVVFKGGSEALNTNKCLFGLLTEAASEDVPAESFVMIETREDVNALLDLDDCIDLLIPRGSNSFVRYIKENTRIPVLGHASGVCHVYVDSYADTDTALKVALDSKVQYPAVCNAAETLLVHRSVAEEFLPAMGALFADRNVEIRCDRMSLPFMPGAVPAADSDWDAEYDDLVIAVKVVDSLHEAVEFINAHGSHHTDSIITGDMSRAAFFVSQVDSADVFINASTRFADGYRFGKGAEVGISTNKIHSRGPVGMEGLMIYKYILVGNGHVVGDYADGTRKYKHIKDGKKLELM